MVVPVRDTARELSGLQFIDVGGTKRFLKDGSVHGHYFQIGGAGEAREELEIVCVAEGFATGASEGAPGRGLPGNAPGGGGARRMRVLRMAAEAASIPCAEWRGATRGGFDKLSLNGVYSSARTGRGLACSNGA